jgi:uncharacterized protein
MTTLQSNAWTAQNEASLIGKVFAYFGLALLLTGAGVFLGAALSPFLFAQPLVFWGILALELLLIFTSNRWAHIPVWGVLIFGAFAVLSGVSLIPILGSIAMEFNGYGLIGSALLTSTTLFGAAALFAMTTQKSLASLQGVAFMGLLTLLVVSIIGIFIPWSNSIEMIVSGGGAALFAVYAAIDVNRLRSAEAATQAPLLLAMSLYLDFFNLFVYVLRFIASLSRD